MSVFKSLLHLLEGSAHWKRALARKGHLLTRQHSRGELIRKGALIGRRALNRIILVEYPLLNRHYVTIVE